jgi:Domain of unknown function (DUF4337)
MLKASNGPVERNPAAERDSPRHPQGMSLAFAYTGGKVEAHEIAEKIHEEDEPPAHVTPDAFRRLTGIYVGVVAMLLAIASLGGGNATKEMLAANIHASDTYNFYQAKYIRQLQYETAAEQIQLFAAGGAALPAEQAAKAADLVKQYRATAARYESEPATGNGKKELLAKAHEWEQRRDIAAAQNPNFEFAEAAYQIAIVLGSVAIVAASPLILGVSGVLACLGVLLTLNGFLLLVPLGHG